MKKPIAEFLRVAVKPGAETARTQYDHEAWQILRRKQGYVTHRLYQAVADPLHRLIYSEWESRKALAGARQHLQGTASMRRARSLLDAAPQQLIVELGGRVVSTKGIPLPEGVVAAVALIHLANNGSSWHLQEDKLWRALSTQPGHVGNLVFRAFDDSTLVGSFSHWADHDAFEKARGCFEDAAKAHSTSSLAHPIDFLLYTPLRD